MTRVLLADGQNNHDWRATSLALRGILAEEGSFDVSTFTYPDQPAPRFDGHELVLSNFCEFGGGEPWPTSVIDALCRFVHAGGGLVVFHAAAAAFPGHTGYQDLIGLGWRDRAGHGAPRRFRVEVADPQHPVMRDVADGFDHGPDELWFGLTGQTAGTHVLAEAACEETGRAEPMIWTRQPGAGRVVVTVLGHDPPAMTGRGFRATLTAACAWVAAREKDS